jgi:hypothetical protein
MLMIFGLTAAVALAGFGFTAGRARPSGAVTPVEAHANHELSSMGAEAPVVTTLHENR